jgi:redox-sensitive bicupin YhaK (pirin superfamily)
MIAMRRSEERQHTQRGKRETWCSFAGRDPMDPLSAGFGALESLGEEQLAPGARFTFRSEHAVELITYVLAGALAHEDSAGRSTVIHAGEFQCITAGRGQRHSEANASLADAAHVFHVLLRSSQAGLGPSREQQRFSAAQRRGTLCVVAAPDGRRGSLRIHQDALMHSALLDPGQHLVHELAPGRAGWLHVVSGSARIAPFVLNAGDAVGVTDERAVSLTAQQPTEILLFDVNEPLARSATDEPAA